MESSTLTIPQDGSAICETSQGEEVRARLVRFNRHSAIIEVFTPGVVLQSSEVLTEFKMSLGERAMYFGRAVVRSVINSGAVLVCDVKLEDSWLDREFFESPPGDSGLAERFRLHVQIWQKQYKVLPEFKLHIADMQMFFFELRQWADQIEAGQQRPSSKNHVAESGEATAQLASAAIPIINGLFEKFEEMAAAIPEELRPLHRAYMKRQLHPLVMCAPFAYRTFAKPLGYAGDYEMVNMIGRNGMEGDSLYAKIINAWFLNQPPAVAHRNRVEYLTKRIVEESVRLGRSSGIRLFNLGCGPALELQAFLRDWEASNRLEATLLDFNEETISYVSRVLQDSKRVNSRGARFGFIKKSVFQVLKEGGKVAGKSADAQWDLVYCAGLFDYLPDSVCQRLMTIMYQWVAPGGLLLATNVDASNPLQHGMDYLLDWSLVYRNAPQTFDLRPAGCSAEDVSVKSDITGVNLFLEVRKPSDA